MASSRGTTHVLEVWGDLACFTRPEMKVERYSYPVITPSAARSIFEAIWWKPRARWQVERVEVLKPPRYIALRRNEVKDKGPRAQTILAWRDRRQEVEPQWADGDKASLGTDQKGRTQRQTMALKDVRYRVHAHLVPHSGNANELSAMDEQFLRRARRGQCIYQPYLGCREFPAYFQPVQPDVASTAPAQIDLDVGWMIYDVFDHSRPGKPDDMPFVSVFRARIGRGVLEVPDWDDPAVRKPTR